MSVFSVHTFETAPAEARPLLEKAKAKYGFVPNLLGALAEAPAALEGYATLSAIFEKSSLSAAERQVVLLAVSAENRCGYCMAAHSTSASMHKVPEDVIAALREGQPLPDAKLEALRQFAQTLVAKRGWASEDEVQAFLAAGFKRQQVLDVVLGVALKTLSNYTNHLVSTPLDEAFAPRAWKTGEAS